MTTIRASCETCGDVELTTGDVLVRVCVNDSRGEYTLQRASFGDSLFELADV